MVGNISKGSGFIWNAIKILLAIALVWFIYSKTNLSDISELFKNVSVNWLVVSFLFFCLMTMMKAVQYYMLSGRQTLYARVLSIVVVQNVVTNFIAAGAGIASYLTMFHVDESVRLRKAAATFIIAKIGDLVAVWCILSVAGVILWNQITVLRIAVIVMLAIIPLAIGILLLVIVVRQKFLKVVDALLNGIGLGHFTIIQRGLDALQYLAEQKASVVFRILLTAVACSLVYMALTMLWILSNLLAYSMIIPAAVVVFVSSWIQLISWIPIQVFGGLGVMETSQVYLYGLFGIPAVQMATVSVGLRVSLYLFNLISLLYIPLNTFLRRRESPLQSS